MAGSYGKIPAIKLAGKAQRNRIQRLLLSRIDSKPNHNANITTTTEIWSRKIHVLAFPAGFSGDWPFIGFMELDSFIG
jgi:hypothetical protein